MNAELRRLGHPMLATLLTVSLSAPAEAEVMRPMAAKPRAEARLSDELELMKEEQSVSVPVQAEVGPSDVAKPRAEARLSEELELMKEEESVSIASRYEQPISQAPSNVYVITDEDIRQSGATDLPTVLRRIPGMEVMQTTGADFNVSVRGDNQLTANKLLVMVDGRSIYVDTQGQVYWKAIPVTLPEIKRIEVLKGPASVLYGFNAFDGIINIITKSPAEMKGTTLQFGGGEYGTISSAAIHAGVQGKLGYRLSVGHDQNQQWRDRDALAFRANKFNVQTEYALTEDSRVLLSGGLVDVNRFDGPVTSVTINADQPALGYAHAVYERPNAFLRFFWNSFDDTSLVNPNPLLNNLFRFTNRTGNPISSFRGNTYNVEGQHAVTLPANNRITYGINYRLNTLSSNYISSYSTEQRFGLYAENEWQATRQVTVVAGARVDLDSFIHPTVSPRVSFLYAVTPEHTFRATFSVAYRPPTLFETYSSTQAQSPLLPQAIPFQGSTGLAPEEIVSYEVGYQGWYWNHRLRLRANMFFNHITNLITSALPTTYTNDPGQADIYGGEAETEFLVTQWLSGFANFSYQEVGQSFQGQAQRAVPRFKWNMGLRAEFQNGINGEAAFHHYGSVTYPISSTFATFAAIPNSGVTAPDPRVGSYNLLNLRGGYKFWKQKAAAGYLREAEVAVSAFNALNDKHQEHPLGDTIGSRVMGWLTVRF